MSDLDINNELIWPPKNWSLEPSGKTNLVFLVLLMLYLPLWVNIIIFVIAGVLVALHFWNKSLLKEIKQLEIRKAELQARILIFKKVENHSNKYNYRKYSN